MQVILIILDGWGIAPSTFGNAITSAQTPTIDEIASSSPSLALAASGIAVGLPWGEEGNSEVGHLNMGAGKTVFQYLPRIISAIREGTFFQNPALRGATEHVKKYNSSLHLMGLVSSGSVHSYIDHLYALLELARREGLRRVYLHIFTDGKDSPPQEADKFIAQLNERLKIQKLGTIATIIGRIYAMDRNENWDATQKTYELLTAGKGKTITDVTLYLKDSYEMGVGDQHIEPAILNQKFVISEGDAVIFFNFREDSARQLSRAFTEEAFDKFQRVKISNLFFVSMTQYEDSTPLDHVAFPRPDISVPLARVLSQHKKKQLHIAESEKYAHITYFFNGFIEKAFPGEERILVPSYGAPHYEQYPAMGAEKIADLAATTAGSFDFTLINFANADMLAHTGNMQAAIQGIEAIDRSIRKILEHRSQNTAVLITADHGNAEEMLDPQRRGVKTKHTTNPVPFYVVYPGQRRGVAPKLKTGPAVPLVKQEPKGVLADVAPTILELMGIPIPKEMTGQSLLPLLTSAQ